LEVYDDVGGEVYVDFDCGVNLGRFVVVMGGR